MPLRGRFQAFLAHPLFRPWAGVLAAAVALTMLVMLKALPDEASFVREVQGWAFPGETVSDAVRELAATQFVIVLGFLIAIGHQLEGDRRAAMVLVVLLVVLVVTQAGLKELVDQPRPSEVALGIEVRASQTSPSFPAGHVMGPTVVYGWAAVMLLRPGTLGAAPWFHRQARWALAGVLVAIVGLTGIVNVWLGVHWLSDIVGGYLWGFVLLLPGLVWAMRR